MAPVGIYRIEHPEDGDGPFRSFREPGDLAAERLIPRPDQDDLGPFSRFEHLRSMGNDMVFGFADPRHLRRYFKTDVPSLIAAGFKVVEYLVPTPAVMFGNTQAAFDRKQAIRGQTLGMSFASR